MSDADKIGLRYRPFAFSEHGVLMLASVLNSEMAIQINIQIVRIFNRMREILTTHKDVLLEIELIKNQLSNHDNQILMLFEYLKQFEETKQLEIKQKARPKLGFKSQN